ncbi:MAG: hypothetical protein WCL14_04980 [Bacteroidota bacterium]
MAISVRIMPFSNKREAIFWQFMPSSDKREAISRQFLPSSNKREAVSGQFMPFSNKRIVKILGFIRLKRKEKTFLETNRVLCIYFIFMIFTGWYFSVLDEFSPL